jgi:hypothetical protein
MSKEVEVEVELDPRLQFKEFLLRKNRFGCVVAHRRSGKSFHAIMDMVRRASSFKRAGPPCRYALVGPTRDQIKNIAWMYIRRFCERIPNVVFNEQDLMVTFPHNKATIRLYSGDAFERLRGVYLDGVILDEVSDIDPQAWYSVIRPTLLDYKGWCIFTGTPKGRGFLWRMWQQALTDPEWFSLMLRADESGIIDANELASIKAGTPDHLFRQEMLCDFSVGKLGAIYSRLLEDARNQRRVSNDILWHREVPVFTSWDIGAPLNQRVWIWQMVGDRIVFLESLFGDHNCGTPAEWVARLQVKQYNYASHFIPHDGATANGGLFQGALATAGLTNVVPVPRQQSVWDGINLALEAFPRISFNEEGCRDGIDALDQYHSKSETDGVTIRDIPVHDHASHAADAFSIAFQAISHGLVVDRRSIPKRIDYGFQRDRPTQAKMGFRG